MLYVFLVGIFITLLDIAHSLRQIDLRMMRKEQKEWDEIHKSIDGEVCF